MSTDLGPRRSSGRVKHASAAAVESITVSSSIPAPPSGRSLRPRRSSAGIYSLPSDPDSDSDEYVDTPESFEPSEPRPERGTGTGKSLRPRAALSAPVGLNDYIATDRAFSSRKKSKHKQKQKPKRAPPGDACQHCRDSRKKCDRRKPRCGACVKAKQQCVVRKEEDKGEEVEEVSVRAEIRKSLEETKKKRDAFYVKYRDLFEPLLPEKNYISKMIEKMGEKTMEEEEEEEEEAMGVATVQIEVRDGGNKKPEETQSVTVATAVEATQPVAAAKEVVPYKLLEHQPEHVKATMKPYQLSGLSFLVWLYNNGASGILGDEMGLGKTLQTLSLFSYLTTYEPAPEGHQRPFLVVCPLSVLSSWIAECKRWTPHLRVLRFHGPVAERSRLKKLAETGDVFGADDGEGDGEGRGYDVVVTSYEVYEREKTWFRRAFVWRYVVLDEGHKIKNEKTNIATSLQGLAAEYRLILTGTPLQNNLTELWALLHWLYPDVFSENTSQLFSDAFNLTLGKNNLSVMDSARRLLELAMLRRMKESKGVNLDLPKKTEVVVYLPLTPMQRFWYKRLLTRMDKGLLEGLFKVKATDTAELKVEATGDAVQLGGLLGSAVVPGEDNSVGGDSVGDFDGDEWTETRKIVEQQVENESNPNPNDGKWRKLMNLLMQLRKCCNHPYLLPNAEPEDAADLASSLMLASSKMVFLDKLLEELCIKQGKKVLIFSGFTKMLDVCEDFMHLKGGGDWSRFKYGRLDGTTPRARRNLAIRLFNSDPAYKVMLISTRAGGLGINLASASDVVMLDTDWNPQADLQAQARAHRIGQVNPVTVYRLITQGTVEEQMMGRILKKLYLSAKVTETMRDIHTSTHTSSTAASTTSDDLPTLSTGQLMSLVRAGSRAIARPEISPTEMLKWDWPTMIQKCREYQETHSSDISGTTDTTDAADEEAERRWLSELERVESRVFEGKLHSTTAPSNRDIALSWTRESRRLGMERVVMINGHAVLKETVGNSEWEAVKTLAGSDPRFAEPLKRKREAINHQDYCQICFDGGNLQLCAGCPRVYHIDCLPEDAQMWQMSFYCPQHQCRDCEQKTANVGGLIFRCRWCEAGYCEDCLDWDEAQFELIGESIPEFELLGVEQKDSAFWIKCKDCVHRHKGDPQAREMCEDMQREWEELMENGGLTTATTVEGSEVHTPVGEREMGGKKRKREAGDSGQGKKAKKVKKVAVQ